ncbi:hypothetical protein EZ456_03430 [Pedobacter psychrodurus]|uniref:Uncharacterized protein n=1 Tax=Pedobacter psychrodurus TaxID=2530456 RepID=A0A4R0Q849_9SPHI|nr:hypothetical protein EZ456_03430 [Pedobacter psychrodurus]
MAKSEAIGKSAFIDAPKPIPDKLTKFPDGKPISAPIPILVEFWAFNIPGAKNRRVISAFLIFGRSMN